MPIDNDFTPALESLHRERMANQELARKIESPLPQRVKNVDTGELMDEYGLRVSAEERRRIVVALRRS